MPDEAGSHEGGWVGGGSGQAEETGRKQLHAEQQPTTGGHKAPEQTGLELPPHWSALCPPLLGSHEDALHAV